MSQCSRGYSLAFRHNIIAVDKSVEPLAESFIVLCGSIETLLPEFLGTELKFAISIEHSTSLFYARHDLRTAVNCTFAKPLTRSPLPLAHNAGLRLAKLSIYLE